jgi:hypothetical protein
MPGPFVFRDDVELHVACDPQRAPERAPLRRELTAPVVVMQPRATARKP